MGKTPFVRFDRNDYSVPPSYVRRILTVLANLERVRIVHGSEVVATHSRNYDRGEAIEDPAHLKPLLRYKKRCALVILAPKGLNRIVWGWRHVA